MIFVVFRDRNSHDLLELSTDCICLSEKAAEKLGADVGDTISLSFGQGVKYSVKVGAIAENYLYHNIYMTSEMYENIFGETEYNQILITLKADRTEYEEKTAENLLLIPGVSGESYNDKMRSGFEDMLGSLNIIVAVIIIAAGGFLGVFLHRFVILTAEVDMVMFGRKIAPSSFVWSGLLTVLFAVIINISMHIKIKKVDMASSLKSVE